MEAGRPSDAVLLDDLAGFRRTLLPALRLTDEASAEEALAVLQSGTDVPPVLHHLLQTVDRSDEAGRTFADRPRFALWEARVAPHDADQMRIEQRLDLLRLHRERTVVPGGDDVDHFRAELVRSCARVLREEALGSDHTGSRLDGRSLRVDETGALALSDPDEASAWAPLQEGPYGLLVHGGTDVVAAYWVDRTTGEVVGLVDGARGGTYEESYLAYVNLINANAALISNLCGLSPALGAIGGFMAEVVKWWAAACAAVGGLVFVGSDVPELNAAIRKGICEALMGMMASGITGALHSLFGALNVNICNAQEALDNYANGN